MFDETTDTKGRYILNIMGGKCSKHARQKTYLLRTVELTKTNNITVSQEIIKIISDLHCGQIDFSRLRFFFRRSTLCYKNCKCVKKSIFKVEACNLSSSHDT